VINVRRAGVISGFRREVNGNSALRSSGL